MMQQDELRAVLRTVVSDLVRTRVPKEISASILKTTIDSWKKIVGTDPDAHPEANDHAADVLVNVLANLAEDQLCQGPPCEPGETTISRVTDHLGVWVNNIHKGAVAPPREGLPDDRFWRDLEVHGLSEGHVKKGSMVRGGRPFAWITTRETLESIRSAEHPQLATEIRNYLGLEHFEMGAELLELEYPADALKQTRVAAPTFVEGGGNAAYRSVETTRGWGATWKLGGGPGGPEAVHPPISFTHRFRVRYLGVVETDPPAVDLATGDDADGDQAEILMSILGRDSE